MLKPLPIAHFFSWKDYLGAPKACLRSAKEAGIDHIVLSHELLELALQDFRSYLNFCKVLKEAGLDFVDAHAPFGNFSDLSLPIEEYRPIMLARNKTVLNICAAAGVKTCTIHIGSCRYEQKFPLKRYWDCTERSLEELLPTAEKCGVILNVENVWNPPSQAEHILRLRKKFDTPYLGVCYDSGHAEISRSCHKDDPQSAVYEAYGWLPEETPRFDDSVTDTLAPLAVTCHLHDNNGLRDQHRLPFEGVIQWEKVIAQLARSPRLQCIQNEAKIVGNGYTFAETVRTFQKFSSMLEAERNRIAGTNPAC